MLPESILKCAIIMKKKCWIIVRFGLSDIQTFGLSRTYFLFNSINTKKRFPEAHNKYLIINQQLPNLSFRVCYRQSKSKGKHMYYMITCVFKKVFFLLPFTSQHDLIFHIQVSWKSIWINVAWSIFNPNGSILINYGC